MNEIRILLDIDPITKKPLLVIDRRLARELTMLGLTSDEPVKVPDGSTPPAKPGIALLSEAFNPGRWVLKHGNESVDAGKAQVDFAAAFPNDDGTVDYQIILPKGVLFVDVAKSGEITDIMYASGGSSVKYQREAAPVDAGPAVTLAGNWKLAGGVHTSIASTPADPAGLCVPDTEENHREYSPPADEVAVDADLVTVFQAAQDGPLSEDHVRTLLWHLRKDAATKAALRAENERLTRERDEWHHVCDINEKKWNDEHERADAATVKVAELEANEAAQLSELAGFGQITCINGRSHDRHDGCLYCERDRLAAENERLIHAKEEAEKSTRFAVNELRMPEPGDE